MNRILIALTTACVVALAPTSASALTVDFTNDDYFDTNDNSELFAFGGGTLEVTLSATGGPLYFQAYDGGEENKDVANLVFANDGVGVGDDEITNYGNWYNPQSIIVTFSEVVSVVGFHFLDLFTSPSGRTLEEAQVWRDGVLVASFLADLVFQNEGGYKFGTPDGLLLADTLVFTAAKSNDRRGNADFALAAIDVVAVPLPATLPLLAGGLGLLGYLGRRRNKTTAAAAI